MKLEDVVKIYGMNDYYDNVTGNIYKLSQAVDNGNGMLNVPVESWDGNLLGCVAIYKQKKEGNENEKRKDSDKYQRYYRKAFRETGSHKLCRE